jgi:hypothetical protein
MSAFYNELAPSNPASPSQIGFVLRPTKRFRNRPTIASKSRSSFLRTMRVSIHTMQPFQLLLALVCAAGSSAKTSRIHNSKTRTSARSLAVPPPVTVNGLRPFQFPTDYTMSEKSLDEMPEMWIYCSRTSETIIPSYVDELVNGSLLRSTLNDGTIPSQTGWVWWVPAGGNSSQIHVCNYNRHFSFSMSAGVFRKINTLLGEYCGEVMAGYVYIDSPWDVAIGRNSTDSQGYPQPECGGELLWDS